MNNEKRSFRLTFTEGCLGTKSGNPEVFETYIASKRPDGVDQEEIDAMPPMEDQLERGSTLFARTPEGVPVIFDYQIKGFFKDSQKALQRFDDASCKMTAFNKVIDGVIFIEPRQIALKLPEGKEVGWCQRSIRVNTPQGERVSLVRSEEVPAGTTLDIVVTCFNSKFWDNIERWFNYGAFRGIGQWRNSGKGRFTWVELC